MAQKTYKMLNEGRVPTDHTLQPPGGGKVNTAAIAGRLAKMAQREVDGERLTDDDHAYIEEIGPLLESVTLGSDPYWIDRQDSRSKNGIPVVADVYTNVTRNEVLELAVGPVLDGWVAVPNRVGRRMTQGAFFSFYSFKQPMSNRLNDEQWNKRIDAGEMPDRPGWTESFIQPKTVEWR
jgi:hypothetical protein